MPATVPNFTPVTPLKPVPVMVTLVPPAVDPEVTLRPVTVGVGGAVKVNWSATLVALVPPATLTVTSTVPADSAGEVAVIEVVELTTTPVPATVPNFTPVTPLKPVPVMVTLVPPAVNPEVTVRPVTVGVGGAVKVKWSARLLTARAPRRADRDVDGGRRLGRRGHGDRGGRVDHDAGAGHGAELHAGDPAEAGPGDGTEVPPVVDPEVGVNPVTVGTGGAVKVKWSAGALTARSAPPRRR